MRHRIVIGPNRQAPAKPRITTRGAVAGAWRRRVNSLVRMPFSAKVCAYVIHFFRQIRTTRRADMALLYVCRLADRAASAWPKGTCPGRFPARGGRRPAKLREGGGDLVEARRAGGARLQDEEPGG